MQAWRKPRPGSVYTTGVEAGHSLGATAAPESFWPDSCAIPQPMPLTVPHKPSVNGAPYLTATLTLGGLGAAPTARPPSAAQAHNHGVSYVWVQGPTQRKGRRAGSLSQEASTFCWTAAGPGAACGWMAFCCCTACCFSFSSCCTCTGWATTVCPANSDHVGEPRVLDWGSRSVP